ncbi:PR56 [Gallid alphaherpesvirus 3]|uniref:PR56 n=1 Tax=Gallid alphaherpesvirus 3 TaxID=35250 RepID=F8TC74_9ALPH|nr:PR56 [Gallid alphaherpesvirus 3]YP_010795698.1 PR56 [Gallid alphaherpesvirus 3]AEI00285.1 PR56 [Gallid alphaherpesvirus 3]AEI00307.1 PR56 [Gallid alphaherpesvirus 3]QEY02298.1 PR56 [Gallid alphaherpesvirus 3]QEY02299.1 PR56 [Gallid alphaherpesvirus 3]
MGGFLKAAPRCRRSPNDREPSIMRAGSRHGKQRGRLGGKGPASRHASGGVGGLVQLATGGGPAPVRDLPKRGRGFSTALSAPSRTAAGADFLFLDSADVWAQRARTGSGELAGPGS